MSVWITGGGAAAVALVALIAFVVLVTQPLTAPAPPGAEDAGQQPIDVGIQPKYAPIPELDLQSHPLYTLAPPATSACPKPELKPESSDSWEAFTAEVGPCLDDIWLPLLQQELGLRPPPLDYNVVSQAPPENSTDLDEVLAYYSSEDNSINFVLTNIRRYSARLPQANEPGVWLALFGHEYAHYIQRHTTILDLSAKQEQDATEDKALEFSRRTELQADCLGAASLRALDLYDSEQAQRINTTFNAGGHSTTHGSAANARHWFTTGWNTDELADCNTFAAEAALVS
ncbi:hypothetical protein GCM10022402_05980 [Salinactinospora qingdaonensis]|uniref:Metalloprotease n=2 Tax=Salinactinospora qingdaonensis TaxID=702744 RepID=A0ABP7EZL0_9ACTN